MFIFFIFLLSFSFSIHSMEKPHKRGAQDSLANTSQKSSRAQHYSLPTLEGIPDDVKEMILEYIMFDAKKSLEKPATVEEIQTAQEIEAAQEDQPTEKHPVDYALKTNHACFRINKKFTTLSNRASIALLTKLERRYPTQFSNAVNETAASSKNSCPFFQRLIQASKKAIFDFKHRINPLMIAVGYDNEVGVELLLKEAEKRRIIKAFVNLDCGQEHNDSNRHPFNAPDLPYNFECPVSGTALHIACHEENKTSTRILQALLEAGANPNAQDEDGFTPLGHAILLSDNAVQQIVRTSFLLKAGTDQTIPTVDKVSPEEMNAEPISENCPPIYKKQRAAIQSLFKKYSKSE